MVGLHIAVGFSVIALNLAAGATGGLAWFRDQASVPFWYLLRAAQVSVFVQALLGGLAGRSADEIAAAVDPTIGVPG